MSEAQNIQNLLLGDTEGIRIITNELNGKTIAYTNKTEFLVQVGKGDKGSYKTRYRFVGELGKAVFHFNCINIGYGFKKRLIAPSFNKPLLAKQTS